MSPAGAGLASVAWVALVVGVSFTLDHPHLASQLGALVLSTVELPLELALVMGVELAWASEPAVVLAWGLELAVALAMVSAALALATELEELEAHRPPLSQL